jgi:hypothetical protein
MSLTVTDTLCSAGGSPYGVMQIPGDQVASCRLGPALHRSTVDVACRPAKPSPSCSMSLARQTLTLCTNLWRYVTANETVTRPQFGSAPVDGKGSGSRTAVEAQAGWAKHARGRALKAGGYIARHQPTTADRAVRDREVGNKSISTVAPARSALMHAEPRNLEPIEVMPCEP